MGVVEDVESDHDEGTAALANLEVILMGRLAGLEAEIAEVRETLVHNMERSESAARGLAALFVAFADKTSAS